MLSAMVVYDASVAMAWIQFIAGMFGVLCVFMIIAQFFQTFLFGKPALYWMR